MLYRTHKRYGILSGILTIPLMVTMGMVPVISRETMNLTTILNVALAIYIGLRGASFGSEFCDCDSYGGVQHDKKGNPIVDDFGNVKVSKGSIPTQKHPLISKTFKAFGVKHRGKFSHDLFFQGVFWGIIYLIVYWVGKGLVSYALEASRFGAVVINIVSFIVVWLLSVDMIDMGIVLSDILKGRNRNKATWKLDQKRMIKIVGLFVVLSVIMLFTGTISLSGGRGATVKTAIMYMTLSRIYVIFTVAGVYSHLIADMMTNEGINIFGKRISPAKLVIKMKKLFFVFPIIFAIVGYFYYGKYGSIIGACVGVGVHFMVATTDLKTGSKYEDVCRFVVTCLCVPATILAIKVLFGGVLQGG